MARTSSQKLEFWQFEVGLFNDCKMVDLNEKYGTLGESVYFRILSYIASSEGYYALLNDALILSIYRSIGSKWIKDRRIILGIIDYCGVCGLFDVNLLRQNVITSCGIQRRWLYAKEKARAKGFTTDKFWLLNSQGFDCCSNNKNKCSNNEDCCSKNEDKCDNNMPHISKVNENKETPNPLQGGGIEELGEDWKEKFFRTYTLFERKNYKDEGVDYKTLYQEFEKSSSLQRMWSFPKVVKLYPQISKGDFRDKHTEQQQRINAADDRADRERYYSSLQAKAQSVVLENLKKAKSIPRFNEIEKDLSGLEFKIAKAELYQPEITETLEKEKNDLLEERRACLGGIGLTEIDLIPKYRCSKCSDTGWLPNGRACDCYSKK